jgi:23S rRNA C2498 (ribose-2'-O)-methylase RlmM
MKEGLENFIRDVSHEIERLHYNQVIINRSLVHLKKMLDHLRGGRMEEIANFLESYKNENSETEIVVREVDETAEGRDQEVSG